MTISGYIPLEEIGNVQVAYLVKEEYVKYIIWNVHFSFILWTFKGLKKERRKKEKGERGRNIEGEGEEKVKKHRETGREEVSTDAEKRRAQRQRLTRWTFLRVLQQTLTGHLLCAKHCLWVWNSFCHQKDLFSAE